MKAKQIFDFFLKTAVGIPIILFCFFFVFPQRIPVKNFNSSDGLVNNRVSRIYQDRKGFLWFATWEGLSRFDGYEFVNYGKQNGLPAYIINDLDEDKDGNLWIAANDGGIAFLDVSQFFEDKSKIFKAFKIAEDYYPNKVNRILVDSKNNIWCLTDDGLFRAAVSVNPVFSLIKEYPKPIEDFASHLLFEDENGSIWFAVYRDLYEYKDEKVINHGSIKNFEQNLIQDGTQSRNKTIIVVSNTDGLFEYNPQKSEWREMAHERNLLAGYKQVLQDKDNNIWLAGNKGLLKISDRESKRYTGENGFFGENFLSVFQDRDEILWSGSIAAGVNKISNENLITFTGQNAANYLFSSPNKSFSYQKKGWLLSESAIISRNINSPVLTLSDKRQINFMDFLKSKNLLNLPLQESANFFFYEDTAENSLWYSDFKGNFYRFNLADLATSTPEIFRCESAPVRLDLMINDRKGGIWIFDRTSSIFRIRRGKCEQLSDAEGEKISLNARSVFIDSRGWLWIGTRYEGAAVCKNPAAENPEFEFYDNQTGLPSISVWSITEDLQGRMYFGTGNGLSRFDVNRQTWQTFNTKDGLADDTVNNLQIDAEGNVWIKTTTGVSKLNTAEEKADDINPPIFITRISLGNKDLAVPETGLEGDGGFRFETQENNLAIQFVGLEFKRENALNYQHKLENTDTDWSKPDKNRSITFANLAAGEYTFSVRAVNQENLASNLPASFRFRILPPFYLRWWFLLGLALIAVSIIYYLYRMRLQKLLEIERTRTLIATDLHDDIGSNLSKISVLSEVVRIQLNREGKADDKLLSSIADISRKSVSAMGDIVWAINPKRDSASEMVRKMRESAEEMFVPNGVTVKFDAPENADRIKLSMDLRRELYLIFKEAINNIAKYSKCTQVEINLALKHGEIIFEIADNGIGFDLQKQSPGNGLRNMQIRTEKLKGKFLIETALHKGTKISVRVPQK